MCDEKTRIRFFAAVTAAAVIALACLCGQVFADGIAEKSSEDEPEANRLDVEIDPKSTESGFTAAWFDSLVFGDKSDAATFRVRVEKLLEKKVSAAQQICPLSDLERRKLVLAGHGDIKRLFDRIERARLQVCGTRLDVPAHNHFSIELVEQKTRAFGHSDPFSYGSLFDKTLRHDLSFEQLVRYKRWESVNLHVP